MDVAFLRGLTAGALHQWTEKTLGAYLDVNSADAALLGQLLRLGVPVEG